MSNRLDELRVSGEAVFAGPVQISQGLLRTYLAQEDAMELPIDLGNLKVWDSGQPLPATPATDDLGLIAATWGTGNLNVGAGDCKAATVTRRARFKVVLPPEYVAGQPVKIRFAAGMLTTVSDTTCTIDCEAFKVGRNSLVSGSDLVTTAALTINSLTFADKDFTVTATNLAPGDVLDARVTIACVDGATATAVTPTVAAIDRILSIKG